MGRLLGVSEQVVAGVNYKMRFATKDGEYEVIVWVQPWSGEKQCLSIRPLTIKE